jgi:RNA polymerase sigma-70 factor, ECF subfamily
MPTNTEKIWNDFCCQLKAYILKRIADPSLADDILQDIFLKIHAKIETLKDGSKIQSWVYQIAQHTIIDYYRKHKNHLEDIDNVDIIAEPPSEMPVGKIGFTLREMIEALPEKYAQALLLVELEGLSQIDLANKLGISVSGAKSRVQRGRQLLKDSLMNCCHYEFDHHGTVIDYHPITCCCCHKVA